MKFRVISLWVLCVIVLAGCYTNPVTGRKSLVAITSAEEVVQGEASFQGIRSTVKTVTDERLTVRVKRVGERLAKAVGEQMPGAKWEFVVFDSREVNAFALPGGKVGVYSGLLSLAENDGELAIVIGHEIGHVIARHGAERMTQAMVIAGVGSLGAAAVEEKTDAKTRDLFLLAYGGATTVLGVLPHSRSNESEADRMGIIYAARAGYDPRAAIGFWQKMAHQKGSASAGSALPAWLATHPSDQKRIVDLQAQMPEVVPIFEANRSKFQ